MNITNQQYEELMYHGLKLVQRVKRQDQEIEILKNVISKQNDVIKAMEVVKNKYRNALLRHGIEEV